MRTLHAFGAPLLVLCAAALACGGSSADTACTVTLSGALTGTFSCHGAAGGAYVASTDQGFVTFQVVGGAGGAYSVFFDPGRAGTLRAGTVTSGDADAHGGVDLFASGSREWTARASTGLGSWTLVLTDPGNPEQFPSGDIGYVGAHGTLSATLVVPPGLTADDVVHVMATF